jgi:uncharacterized protein YyaL (SSP411 family)
MKHFILIIFLSFSTLGLAMKDSLPLLNAYAKAIQSNYIQRIQSLGKDYKPRSEHLNKDGSPIYVNDLIFEESPYLLQHAHNPVNWHAWSPQAFELAKKSNKPIFLSIGYATCHWCHVMEHESFENVEIARFINEHFIAIKVDRERRTAIDAYYMTGVQMMTGHGGWPMSNFLTPEGKPFFGGTYYNPKQFMTLLTRVNEVWNKQEPELRKQANQMDTAINQYLSKAEQTKTINQSVYDKTNGQLLSMFDDLQGGFSAAPKFPQEPWLLYLLNQNSSELDKAITFTLNAMQQGGIYDQVGGGFHRYSVDNEWLAPHFEKMLYNQSQLTEVYTLAAVEYNNPEYKHTAIAILDYVLREMTNEQGTFYSASDADSEGVEGLFFTWSYDELKAALNKNDFNWIQNIYHFSKAGNFEHRNILHLSESLLATAKKQKLLFSDFVAKFDDINQQLYQQREKRIHPLIDNKVITGWNGQMIYSLANSSNLLNQNKYLKAGIKAMNTILTTHLNQQGLLVRNSLNGKPSNIHAELEDYAWVITALIKLYDITDDTTWLEKAGQLIKQCEQLFWDKQQAGFFDNIPEDNIPNTSRIKKSEDGATVSANGQLLIALARYYRRTGDLHIDELYTQSLASFSGKIVNNPISHGSLLRAKRIYENGENNNIAYIGNGHVKITTSRNSNKFRIKFNIQKGWHINANVTSVESLIPLQIKTSEPLKFIYPDAKTTQLDFIDGDLTTFEGEFEVTAATTNTSSSANKPIQLNLNLQACSNKICLAPSHVKVKIY